MLALPEEVEQAQAEGVDIIPSRAVDSFVAEGGCVSAIRAWSA